MTSHGIAASTVYAALNGKRLPSRKTLAKIVAAWGGDESEWMARRSLTEDALHTEANVSYTTNERHLDAAIQQALSELELLTVEHPAGPLLARDRARSVLGFAATLKVLRASAGNTALRELEFLSGVSRSSLSEILSGHRIPSVELGNRIVTALEAEALRSGAHADSIDYLARMAMRHLIHNQR
ncbi:helix-turn-helix domain-containing protein [Kitasatospora sp. NPDC058190]|uniref:helix-turn-helix domain-containing protein n=1 Tax=Kitasatospora sp. NPDC058190 TaxID=3346371 RepID=UPI0036DC3A3E